MPASKSDNKVAKIAPDNEPGFGVYVHWPFCQAKCPYCDFNSHVVAHIDQPRWARALAGELARYRELTGPREVTSIFFGGGTPSLMTPETVGTVMETIARLWHVPQGVEATLEANPTSVEAENFRGYRAAGINRLSLGVQSLDDEQLKFLGRLHSAQEAMAAIALAREIFPRLSFDLIYARPGQTPQSWTTELRKALSHAADHLSLYQLTIEEGTAFERLYEKGAFRLPDEDAAAALYALTADICAEKGMTAYEVSNYAVPGAECAHNLVYWRYGDYVGVGPGAHGRLSLNGKRIATTARRMPGDWIEAVEETGDGTQGTEEVSPSGQGDEMALMGLRLEEGVSLARYEALTGRALPEERLARLEAQHMIAREQRGNDTRLIATPDGRMVLDALLGELLA
ncbi:radical SAM family heme chaperone HemW [Parvibaculum sp. MBR-TMA-1.3b-4.2]|jgi:oxygen-independent coproporphyrinogen-3 oxidase